MVFSTASRKPVLWYMYVLTLYLQATFAERRKETHRV